MKWGLFDLVLITSEGSLGAEDLLLSLRSELVKRCIISSPTIKLEFMIAYLTLLKCYGEKPKNSSTNVPPGNLQAEWRYFIPPVCPLKNRAELIPRLYLHPAATEHTSCIDTVQTLSMYSIYKKIIHRHGTLFFSSLHCDAGCERVKMCPCAPVQCSSCRTVGDEHYI